MINYLKMRPMLICGLCVPAVCVIGFYSRTAVFFVGLAMIFLFFFFLRKCFNPVYTFIIFMLIAASVSTLITLNKADSLSMADSTYIKGSFVAVENSVYHGNYYSAVLKTDGCNGLPDGTRVLAFSYDGGFECGDKIFATAELSMVEEEYKASDYSDQIYITASIKDITVLRGEGDRLLSAVNKLRNYISDTLFSSMKYKEAATLNAIVLGDRSYLSDSFYGNIKAAGVSHVMVVSGMHLAIIVSLASGAIEKVIYNRYLKAALVVITVLFMLVLCGFTKSIIRAGVCYILYAVSIILKRDNTPENTLGGAVTLILIAQPFTIFSVSFQLSVLATLGISAVALPIINHFKEKVSENRLIIYIFSSAVVALSALLFTLPVTVWVFGYISTVSVITNLLISYAVTPALTFAAVGLVLCTVIPLAAQIFFTAAFLVVKYMNFVIDLFGSLPFSVMRLGRYTFVFSLFLLFSVIFFLFACKRKQDMLKLKIICEKQQGRCKI